MITTDDSIEIRTILYKMHELIIEAQEAQECNNNPNLANMVINYLPLIEQSYKRFIEDLNKTYPVSDIIDEVKSTMFIQCFHRDNPEDMQKMGWWMLD